MTQVLDEPVLDAPPRRRRVLNAVLLVALLASGPAAYAAWDWRTSPDAFRELSPADNRPTAQVVAQRGPATYLRLTHEKPGAEHPVTVHDVPPQVLVDSDAQVQVLACMRRPGSMSLFAETAADLKQYCETLRTVDGVQMDLSLPEPDYLVLAVTLRESGVYAISGADVTYSYGWQRGTQRVGDVLVISAR